MDLLLQGKTALVTGSNKGTGETIARTLTQEGATVVFHSLKQGLSEEARRGLANSYAVWGDIATDAGAQQTLQQTHEAVGDIDILVNNYGTPGTGNWGDASTEDWIDMYQKNVLSGMRLIQGVMDAMKHQHWGRIVQLGTIGSHQPNSFLPHYYSAKGALATMGVSLTKELSHTGVTVNTVSPGFIRTPELEAMFRQRAKREGRSEQWDDIQAHIIKQDFPNPCGRMAEREEVADLVAFLCSDRAGFINGQNIRIDGGAIAYV